MNPNVNYAADPNSPGGSDEGYLKWKANSQIDWIWKGLDLGMTVHYLDGFHEILAKTGQLGFSGHPPKLHPVVLTRTASRSIG